MQSRSEYLAWLKERALIELDHSGTAAAISSVTGDMRDADPSFRFDAHRVGELGTLELLGGGNADSIREFIEGLK